VASQPTTANEDDSLTPDVVAAAHASGLGEFVREYSPIEWYRPARRDLRPLLAWLFKFALFLLLSVPLDVFLAVKLVGVWLAGLVLLAGGVLAWLVIRLLRKTSRGFRYNNSVAQFHGGLVFRHFTDVQVVRWTDVTEVYENIQDSVMNDHYFGTDYFYSLTLADRRRVKFIGGSGTRTGLAPVVLLGRTVAREVTAQLLPAALATIRAGGRVDFGRVTAQLDGIHTPAGLVAWGLTEAFRRDRLRLRVRVPRTWGLGSRRWKRDIRRIRNFPLLWALVQLGPGAVAVPQQEAEAGMS